MQRHSSGRAVAVFLTAALTCVLSLSIARAAQEKPPREGWQVPPGAEEEENPMQPTPQVLVAGRALFEKNCRRCHGPKGVGDGPDAELEHMADMDLTNPRRAAENADGVVFHKVWNGREDPKMPAFKNELSRQQIWTIVTYVQTLRRPSSQ